MRPVLLAFSLCALAAGCAVGPDYLRPAVDAPPAWRVEYPEAAGVADTRWWEQFGDPALDSLIETALRENRDLRIAAARVDQFLGLRQTTRSQFFPQISAAADASRSRASERGVSPIPAGIANPSDFYQAQAFASWEIDLFGRIRRADEAALAQVLSAEEARRGVILTLVTGMASGYIALRGLDQQLEISRATAKNYGESLRIFRLRYEGGTVSLMELAQIQSQYQQALAAIPLAERRIAEQENALSVLLGRNPGPIERGRSMDEMAPPAIPAGLPSSLLERRPDLRQAEQDLVAANAQIGAAKALYFPVISLTGALGSASTDLSDLFSGPAGVWSIAAAATAPIFTFGAIEGQVRAAEAVQVQALERYLQTVESAFRETNDALIGTQKSSEQAAAELERVKALREYARLARLRYDNGVSSYVEVLVAENDLFSAELGYVQTRADSLTQLINVYRAMGGGWVDQADAMTQPVAATGQ
jgi:multidrug efflux system outer membrane protein